MLLRDLGVDERAVLRRAGLPLSVFEGEGTHLSLDDYYTLHEAVEAEASDPTIALRAGSVASLELFDPALFAAICSPNLNTAASRLGQFKRLVGPFGLDVDVGARETRITFRCKYRPDVPRNRGVSELVFLVAFARRATRHHITPTHVVLPQPPSDDAPYTVFFGRPLTRGDAYAVAFGAQDAARPFLTHNEPMWKAFEPSLRRRMTEAGDTRSTREQVQAALFELLPSGRANAHEVAKELGMGTRTLQRRLAAEESSWLEVLNETRERLARHYLSTTEMSAAQISFLLGFEDPNSLFRAFQRWTGTTPESFRAHARHAP
ncbi:MAG: AraC family transcriptional regulator ligand-binding domain-containing protein [Sandaracinus sp.]|nr:AraC family transcriptional regulator ligand-binding domain-containing protein [Sandaracinus sp.]MCB9619869.1 AraC family transcriptional regulator ligand-binding domain-containing protein [Sandaracinus sp.]